jgi:magnesium-transporting ATPase (P-type)
MITGDKMETAENISYSCHLFTSNTQLFRIRESDGDVMEAKLNEIILALEEVESKRSLIK